MTVMKDADLYQRLRTLLSAGWIELPDHPPFRGTGGPGKMLERQLGLDGGNYDSPDSGRWEIKYHSGSALLTLFHLEARPKGHMNLMVPRFGWPDSNGRTSFRHTIRSHSDRGFYVENAEHRITIRNNNADDFESPYWTHDQLINAFVAKFRRLILVSGSKAAKRVKFVSAGLYSEPRSSQFIEAIQDGTVAIDFDARTTDTGGIRNHGTKFRIKTDDLYRLYENTQVFE